MELSVTDSERITKDAYSIRCFKVSYNNIDSRIVKHAFVHHIIKHCNEDIIGIISKIEGIDHLMQFERTFIQGALIDELVIRFKG